MPEFCSCGAQLPPDALFCHKCGKPQREIVVPEPVIEPAPHAVAPPPLAAAVPLNFHNPVAVKIATGVAAMATLVNLFLPFLSWIAAGFFAVLFYRRKTGSMLDVGAGVRMGWITGILMFALFAIVQVPVAVSGKLGTLFQDQMKNFPRAQDPVVQQMMQFFQTGPGIATLLLFTLVMGFVFITGLSMAGGAIGAKMVGRE
jgi:uncharacterized membrane protein YqaE (UPF0057 family)